MEKREIRTRLSSRLRGRGRRQTADYGLLHFLQHKPPALVARRTDAGYGILRQPRNEKGCLMLFGIVIAHLAATSPQPQGVHL